MPEETDFFRPLILASRSPRRLDLLTVHGFAPAPLPADLDDGDLCPDGAAPDAWVASLAYLKARRVHDAAPPDAVVLGADTVVVKDGDIIGQPRDEAHARRTIERLRNGSHTVMTGVALLQGDAQRLVFVDRAVVTVGDIADTEIASYLASGQWRGKAGAYNLADRRDAGWPLSCKGDPATVMGLPIRVLTPVLRAVLSSPEAPPPGWSMKP